MTSEGLEQLASGNVKQAHRLVIAGCSNVRLALFDAKEKKGGGTEKESEGYSQINVALPDAGLRCTRQPRVP